MVRRSNAPVPPEKSDRAIPRQPVRAGAIDLRAVPSLMEQRAAAWSAKP